MTVGADRRSVLTGLGALGVMGCSPLVGETLSFSREMQALEARHGGRLGLALSTGGRRLAYRPDERFVYCSTFKMYLAAATLLRVQAGEERLDRAIPVTQADMVNHAPVTEPAIGGTLTIEQLMKGTVEDSDNPAANILIRELGGLDALRAFYRGIGDVDTRVDRLEPEMNRLDGDKDTITPVQSVANIHRLLVSSDTPLSAASKTLLMRWLVDTPTGMDRIKAGVPTGWIVAHKTGTGGYGPVNDIGVLYPPSGDPIVMAAYFHATRESTDAQREAVIADATRIALSALGRA
ncbi:MAG: class A beta-lactamase [Brevundimonas sp.]|uniref:class A beta-lactamase n=1 Tax=Brevundimonas sp. TaxID=1871086 RepID=UPI0027210A3C|nr:class A beta-lactamase [Brevundimonas sp.]MDO9076818.1 class A beta-lactamase [Brevundimonas sp.]